ncbi:YceI family protein [Corynebacterium pacaense]|uniref:YceI family protein n=1 Tax=Corynebacterium pacaense TaxID=1816684 RepID=UPI0009BB15FB|nr:YceI family protein [Corynebacterium pacaense]
MPTPNIRRRWIIGVITLIALVAVILIGTRIYASTVSSRAEDSPTLSAPPPAPDRAQDRAPTGIEGTWTTTTGSWAGYRLDEVLNGSDVTVTGRTDNVTATIVVTGQELVDATVTVPVADITTDSDRRDNYFRTSAIDTAAHPEATFTLTSSIDVSRAVEEGQATIPLTGELSINGQTRTVSVDAETAFGQNSAQIIGQIPVTWSDFGVQAPDLGFVSVEDSGFIEFSLNVGRS